MPVRLRPHGASIQTLESRQLLSASVPTLTGAPYLGVDGAVGYPDTSDLTIIISRETKSGSVAGTYTEDTNGSVSSRSFTGTVNHKGKLVLHIKKVVLPHETIFAETATGTATLDGNSLTGKLTSGSFRGTFSASRISG